MNDSLKIPIITLGENPTISFGCDIDKVIKSLDINKFCMGISDVCDCDNIHCQICPFSNEYSTIEKASSFLHQWKPRQEVTEYAGLKVGDTLPEEIINEWSIVDNNWYHNYFGWTKNRDLFSFDRAIESFEEKEGVMGFLVSGTTGVHLRADGFKKFMDFKQTENTESSTGYYKFIGRSDIYFTEGKIYKIRNPKDLEAKENFIDDMGNLNGFSDLNYKFFKPSTQQAFDLQEGKIGVSPIGVYWRCTKSDNGKFIIGKIYPVQRFDGENAIIFEEDIVGYPIKGNLREFEVAIQENCTVFPKECSTKTDFGFISMSSIYEDLKEEL